MKRASITLLCMALLSAACNNAGHIAAQYTGAGTLQYLEAPPLGRDGWRVSLPEFDLASGLDATYSLSGLPNGKRYMVQLSLPDPCPVQVITQGTFGFTVSQDGKIIRRLPVTSIADMVDSSGGGRNDFWYYEKTNPIPEAVYAYSFDVNNDSSNLIISISCHNAMIARGTTAHFTVEQGGFK
jgi:hypothetical protein